ncbi:hypothetical protein IWQ61_006124 [Dispira simplex]|nr:hypothetical protein IWQ61_006124 [Dispira simplex]
MGRFPFHFAKVNAFTARLNPTDKSVGSSSSVSSQEDTSSFPGQSPHSPTTMESAPDSPTLAASPPAEVAHSHQVPAEVRHVHPGRSRSSSVFGRFSWHSTHPPPLAMETSHPPTEAQIYHLVVQANGYFENDNYVAAVQTYTRTLELLQLVSPDDPDMVEDLVCMVHSNRSMVSFMREKYYDSLRDAEKVVQTRPLWSKGHFRKAEALLALGMYDLAVIHYGLASDLEPENLELRRFAQRARYLRNDKEQGLEIRQFLVGRDLAKNRSINMVQNKIFDYAKKMRNFIYLIIDRESRQCAVIDACWDVPGLARILKRENLTLVAAIVTHYHFDHVGGIPPPPFDVLHIRVSGLDAVLKKFPYVQAYIHESDIPGVVEANPSLLMNRVQTTHGDFEMTLGARTTLKFIHTPGHSSGSQCILVNGNRLFTGDTLFPASCGRVDLPGGCKESMVQSLQHTLRRLDSDIMVYPGHNYGGSWTTIGYEKRYGLLRSDQLDGTDEFPPKENAG